MTWPVALALVLAAQPLVTFAAILLGELAIEEEHARRGEWAVALALAAGGLVLVLHLGAPPSIAFLATLGGAFVQWLAGAAVARATSAVADYGTLREGLGPRYPVAAAFLLAAVFVPTGLGPALGAPDLFDGLRAHYAVGLVLGTAVLAFDRVLDDRTTATVLRWILTLGLLAGVALAARHAGADHGRTAVALFLLAGVLALEAVAIAFLVFGPEDLDKERLAAEGRLLLVSWAEVLGLWILPLVVG